MFHPNIRRCAVYAHMGEYNRAMEDANAVKQVCFHIAKYRTQGQMFEGG